MSNFSFDLPKNQSNVIKVIGVGGGGSNAINYMFKQGIKGVDFVICNTDAQALENSPVPNKIQLGVSLTEGLGAGANPDVGQQAAIESLPQLEKMLETHTKMVFITAGMGGGTGTGAAPEIAKLSKSKEILTVGIVTIPFQFEGKVRTEQAMLGLEKLRSNVDSLIVINNNKLRDVYGNLGFKAGFSKADEVLATASRGIAEVITHHYTQNIDLKDAKTVLSNSGTAIMGSAHATGENRAKEAIVAALDSPLLNDNKIKGAKNVLLLIVSGNEEITIDEIGEINEYIQAEAGFNANIIMGVGEDEKLGDSISVTIIATGFNVEQQKEIVNIEPKKIIHSLEDEQKNTFDLTNKPVQNKALDTDLPLPQKEIKPEIINYTLFEEVEPVIIPKTIVDENQLIATTHAISNLNVTYEIVTKNYPNNFIKSTPEVREIIVNQPEFIIVEKNIVSNKEEITIEEKPIVFEFNNHQTNQINVNDAIELIPTTEVDQKGIIRFELEEYTELADELMNAKPKKPEYEDEELQFVVKSIEDEDISLKYDHVDPMDMSLEETMKLKALERSKKLKQFNHAFSNTDNVDDLEKQPAYKRLGIEFNEPQTQNIASRTSIENNGANIQFKSNNSFLHDNVD
ncbi:MAG: cell division protein FtsZ [Flavobacterium sp.]